MTSFVLPIRLFSAANLREHYRVRATRAASERAIARLYTQAIRGDIEPADGLHVTITRIGPRDLDSDNLAISAKSVRDGIADAIGVDDGSSWWRWDYSQRRTRKQDHLPTAYGVEVILLALHLEPPLLV